MRNRLRWGLTWLIGLLLVSWLTIGGMLPALASVHSYPESSGGVMWRSLQTLRDESDRAWQAVFYKRVQNGQLQLHLRLVGFPGSVELAHPTPLQITTGTGKTWTAPDVSAGATLVPTVAEYDLKEFAAQFNITSPLRLSLPLNDTKPALLTIPPFVVREWEQVISQNG